MKLCDECGENMLDWDEWRKQLEKEVKEYMKMTEALIDKKECRHTYKWWKQIFFWSIATGRLDPGSVLDAAELIVSEMAKADASQVIIIHPTAKGRH